MTALHPPPLHCPDRGALHIRSTQHKERVVNVLTARSGHALADLELDLLVGTFRQHDYLGPRQEEPHKLLSRGPELGTVIHCRSYESQWNAYLHHGQPLRTAFESLHQSIEHWLHRLPDRMK